MAWLLLLHIGNRNEEDGTLEIPTSESLAPRSSSWPDFRGRALVALLAASLACGCAGQAAEPVPRESVTVPADDTAGGASDDAETGDAEDDIEGDTETVTIDPDVVSYDEYNDPLMPVNRFVFGFNRIVSRYALIPLGKGYERIVPDAVDRRVDSFFDNARTPIYAVNKLLQGEASSSASNLARFGINTTLGLLGFFDPAEAWFGIERRESDFADTLAHYDVGYGTYLVLPFFGPSDLRNATARGVDYFLQPIPYVLDNPERVILLSYGFFHDFADGAEDFEKLLNESDDPYIFFRNLHLQTIQRDAAYRD